MIEVSFAIPEKNEAQSFNGSPPDIIIDIAHRHMQQASNSLVVASATVRHGDGVHGRAPQDGILVHDQRLHERPRLLLAAEHAQGDADGQAAQNLLVLRLLRVAEHVLQVPWSIFS